MESAAPSTRARIAASRRLTQSDHSVSSSAIVLPRSSGGSRSSRRARSTGAASEHGM